MTTFAFFAVLVSLSWLLGWLQGHSSGLLEGRALKQLQDAYPLRRMR